MDLDHGASTTFRCERPVHVRLGSGGGQSLSAVDEPHGRPVDSTGRSHPAIAVFLGKPDASVSAKDVRKTPQILGFPCLIRWSVFRFRVETVSGPQTAGRPQTLDGHRIREGSSDSFGQPGAARRDAPPRGPGQAPLESFHDSFRTPAAWRRRRCHPALSCVWYHSVGLLRLLEVERQAQVVEAGWATHKASVEWDGTPPPGRLVETVCSFRRLLAFRVSSSGSAFWPRGLHARFQEAARHEQWLLTAHGAKPDAALVYFATSEMCGADPFSQPRAECSVLPSAEAAKAHAVRPLGGFPDSPPPAITTRQFGIELEYVARDPRHKSSGEEFVEGHFVPRGHTHRAESAGEETNNNDAREASHSETDERAKFMMDAKATQGFARVSLFLFSIWLQLSRSYAFTHVYFVVARRRLLIFECSAKNRNATRRPSSVSDDDDDDDGDDPYLLRNGSLRVRIAGVGFADAPHAWLFHAVLL